MPSVAQFIKELLSEDKYDSSFNERIEERIHHLNAAQLQGMYNHLTSTAKSAKCDMWVNANKEIIAKIDSLLKERTAEAAKEEKMLEEFRLKNQHKKRLEREARKEKKRVIQMIAETALKAAEDSVREEESKRQAEEKVEIMRKVFIGEEKRNIWWKRTAICLVVSVVVISVTVTNIFILIGCLFFLCLVAAGFAYKAHNFTSVVPIVVDEETLQMEVAKRQDILKKKAFSVLQEKEARFQEAMYRDKMEKKKRIKLRKVRLKFEADLIEARRVEQIAMAKEIMSKNESATQQQMNEGDVSSQLDSSTGLIITVGTREDAISELDDYHNSGSIMLHSANCSVPHTPLGQIRSDVSGADSKFDFAHDAAGGDDNDGEEGPETTSNDQSRHEYRDRVMNRHRRPDDEDERRGLFSDDSDYLHGDSEEEEDDDDDDAVRTFALMHGGGNNGDDSNMCRLIESRGLLGDTHNGEEYSEYDFTPKVRGDIENGLMSPDVVSGNTTSRRSNKYRPSAGNNNREDHSVLNSHVDSYSNADLFSKDNSTYSRAKSVFDDDDAHSKDSIDDEKTAEISMLVGSLSIENMV